MRAARLLRLLLLLQNRGRMTSQELATELEVARRTILRDVDALTEAGLPIIVHRGNQGGIELGFDYRTRLTGLAADEAEALAVMLSQFTPQLEDLGLGLSARRAAAKLFEAFPDATRAHLHKARARFRFVDHGVKQSDPRVMALAEAIRSQRIVHLHAFTATERTVHPVRLVWQDNDWSVVDARYQGQAIASQSWGAVNISAKTFT